MNDWVEYVMWRAGNIGVKEITENCSLCPVERSLVKKIEEFGIKLKKLDIG